jgi:hypothetical protein
VVNQILQDFLRFYQEKEPKETARDPLLPSRRRAGRCARKLAALKQSARLLPAIPLMLGAGQRVTIHWAAFSFTTQFI